jgi:hypothetical protein
MQRTSFLTGFLFFLSACSGQVLDGGSTGGASSSGGNGAPGAEGAGSEIANAPVSGNIAGKPFEVKAIDLTYDSHNKQWFLSIDNYENDCGTLKSPRPASSDAMTVNVGGVETAAGTFPITYGDGHGATLQIGVYEESEHKTPDTRSVRTGTLQLDAWDATPGATIQGAIKLVADDSHIEGTFTAKVCPAR